MHVKKILSPVEKIRTKFLARPKNTLIHQENQNNISCPSKNTLTRQENWNNIFLTFFLKKPSLVMKIETLFFARQKKNAVNHQENQNNISSSSKKFHYRENLKYCHVTCYKNHTPHNNSFSNPKGIILCNWDITINQNIPNVDGSCGFDEWTMDEIVFQFWLLLLTTLLGKMCCVGLL